MNKYIKDYPVGRIASMKPTYLQFGNVKIHCETGEVTENISEDAKQFWKQVKENIIGTNG